jgi:putative oxidoreductase
MNDRCVGRYDVGLMLVRCIVGFVFVMHGSQKLFGAFGGPGMENWTAALTKMGVPSPEIAAWASAITEFAGGILLLLGLLTRVAAIFMLGNMVVAITKVHWGAFFLPHGMEYALTLAVCLLAIVVAGSGDISVTGLIRGRCCRSKTPAGP